MTDAELVARNTELMAKAMNRLADSFEKLAESIIAAFVDPEDVDKPFNMIYGCQKLGDCIEELAEAMWSKKNA